MQDDNYYHILKVKPTASVTEIISAYQVAKSAFSQDSVATYSVLSTAESEEILSQIETAYQVLSNLEKKRQYDDWLQKDKGIPFALKGSSKTPSPKAHAPVGTESQEPSSPEAPSASPQTQYEGHYSLKGHREKRGLTLEDVARITKIPFKALVSIENYDTKNLPVRVYVQGFVKNLATVYKLDPAETVKHYLEHLDSLPR